jgi:hypothetical protein
VDGLVVVGEQPGDQLAAAVHADLGEDRLDVVADGVGRQEQLLGDVGRAGAAGDQAGDLLLAIGQVVGLDDDRGNLRRAGRLDDHRHAGDVEPLHRGFWIRTRTAEQDSPDNPNPLTATYLWGYDPEAGRFSADWFDSNGGRATQTSAGWEGDRLVFVGQMTYGGYRFALRDTFTRRGDDAYHHLGEVDLGQGMDPGGRGARPPPTRQLRRA